MISIEMTKSIVDGLIDLFSENLHFIILYGSVARKDDTAESDIDIAVILKDPLNNEQKERFIELMSRLDLMYDRVFSFVDIDLEKYEKWGDILPFYKNIKREGVVLWKAA